MGTKEVDSWSTPSTRLAKLTTEGDDIAESGCEGWLAPAQRLRSNGVLRRHKEIEGEGEGVEGGAEGADDGYHETGRTSRWEQGRRSQWAGGNWPREAEVVWRFCSCDMG
jgi:hypothetical protein